VRTLKGGGFRAGLPIGQACVDILAFIELARSVRVRGVLLSLRLGRLHLSVPLRRPSVGVGPSPLPVPGL